MSFKVKTGKTTAEFHAVTKTVTNETEHTVSIVYPCDILNPTFSLKGGYIDANYLTGAFGRKYWITDQTIDRGINYLHCTVDAWSSWSGNIYGSNQFVNRSETNGNSDLNDNLYPATSETVPDLYEGAVIYDGSLHYVIGVI